MLVVQPSVLSFDSAREFAIIRRSDSRKVKRHLYTCRSGSLLARCGNQLPRMLGAEYLHAPGPRGGLKLPVREAGINRDKAPLLGL